MGLNVVDHSRLQLHFLGLECGFYLVACEVRGYFQVKASQSALGVSCFYKQQNGVFFSRHPLFVPAYSAPV